MANDAWLAENSKFFMPSGVKHLKFQHCFKCCVSSICRGSFQLSARHLPTGTMNLGLGGKRFINDLIKLDSSSFSYFNKLTNEQHIEIHKMKTYVLLCRDGFAMLFTGLCLLKKMSTMYIF